MEQLDTQVIPFEAVYNFRDMGGYKTRDGRIVKKGLFYRSAALGKMTSADKERFEMLGIKTIFDYRDNKEAQHNPNPVFSHARYIQIPAKGNHAFEMPTNAGGKDFYKVVSPEMFRNFYAQMPFNNPSFKELMKTIQNPDNLGLVHHCAVGKDRTGIGGALILLALDVPEETIMEDYLDTNIHLQPMVEKMAQAIQHQYNEQELQQFYALMSAREDYLQAALDAMDDLYGSKTAFMEQEFGLTAEKRKQLQSYCLT
ncbi:tyrosine-protein phosphatase [Lysinibacillus irui]|uniref:Tyrosine-protein phosphatase n=2 Tax=Lysinibacillus TaxID=400634 RepID=A0AAJ5UVC5_9BACI|nr:tyrosine-protein phosphatase [Lysinibacillus irui]MEA0552596.1 tyrosine-protein phosphatase [Lysinibacillus irui]MEA0562975.1 tyrosine-protein phosphatase [Lysinibacillus irui]MEA0978548.1 tyrosine-protein phosphatase [Lysinibacillus irui]MEA1044702.1 tyrosine-protein phosphatase [Lysinibacillus irui]WDV06580.1 tyrosine-protein phosphatase [Lysinibacillus irui]